jgi:predicted RNA polymerase sigma factor
MLRDVTLAEDLTQEALVAALEHWPVTGVPEKPGAWLMATAKRRALDDLRRPRHARAQARDAGYASWSRSSRRCPIRTRRSTTSLATSCCG